jgi:hypothetical protein
MIEVSDRNKTEHARQENKTMCTKVDLTGIVHPFEVAGLGKAPFRFSHVTENVFSTGGLFAVTKAGGTCDFCGTGIRYEYWIKSHDGQTFKVGCDCVARLQSADNRLIGEVERAKRILDKQIRDAKKKEKTEKGYARVYAAYERLPEVSGKLAIIPHPCGFDGKTMLDYVQWMRNNAGLSGLTKCAKIIETAANQS